MAALRTTGLRQVSADDATVALRMLADRRDTLGWARTQTVSSASDSHVSLHATQRPYLRGQSECRQAVSRGNTIDTLMAVDVAAVIRAGGPGAVHVRTRSQRIMSDIDDDGHNGVVAAVEAWFLGGPVDGRLMPVEATVEGDPPEVVRMPQAGLYVGASEVAASTAEHVYVLSDGFADILVYRYQRTNEA